MVRGWAVGRSLMLLATLFCGVPGLRRAEAQRIAMPLLPSSVAYDAAGNLYFADTNRQVVYESSLAGVLTVVAGSGVQGFSGDGGAATSADLNSPQGVAVGADGTLYIADTANARIRAVSGGRISTIAGSGSVGSVGDGGPALNAQFRIPNALAIDASGALLVCDAGNQRVRRISGGVIETVVGSGVQGFAGDGGAATAAELDTPMGLAVAADGRIFIADSHNQRIRMVATNGVITTFAGSGVRGFSGDGGAAVAAQLSLPRGVVATPGGAVIFADSDNQRIRMVTPNGVISTIVGTGVQGTVSDGTASAAAEINSPRGLAVSSFGAPVYADALNRLVRESASNGKLYVPNGLTAGRTSSVTLNVNRTGSGGAWNAAASVAAAAGMAQGIVELLDGAKVLAQATLSASTATFAPQTLAAGAHTLSVAYLGDGINPAAVSAPFSIDASTAVVTATANAASVAYGQPIPSLAGSIAGVLPQDIGKVTAVFTTTAQMLSPVGSYPIYATLTGPASAGYSVVMSPASGTLQVMQTASLTSQQPLPQASYAGLPLLLTAVVTAAGAGTPTGTVQFVAGGTVIAASVLAHGVASATYLSPPAGTLSIVAQYSGDRNFAASSSQAMSATVAAVPDFTLASAGSTTQTVGAGQVASYPITVAAQSGAFTGVVDLSASGLPSNATVSFSPPQLVPGDTSAAVTMSVQTSPILTTLTMLRRYGGAVFMGMLLPWAWLRRKKRISPRLLAACGILALLTGVSGCGARTSSTAALSAQTYTLTVVGTSTNLAGAVVSHSMKMTLIVE